MISARRATFRAVQNVQAQAKFSATTLQHRTFFHLASKNKGSGVFVTKYAITKDSKDGVDWDDFAITLPERDHLALTNKDIPLFIRFLKLVTDQEGRADDFTDFVKRAKDGLSVESDVYISTDELLAVMWKNGFSDKERNALQFTFPADYKFHYPELSVLFDIDEEHTYKFCLRARMEQSHIGEHKSESQAWGGVVLDHAVIFGVAAATFKMFPFFNYYFVLKGFGTFMVGWTAWVMANRGMFDSIARNEFMTRQKVGADLMEGEDKLMTAMKRFANDSKCLDLLSLFAEDTASSMADYRKALLEHEKNEVIAKAAKQLQSIEAFEGANNAKLQGSIVSEVFSDFKAKFAKQPTLQSESLASAIKSLEGNPVSADQDPVTRELGKAISGVDLSGKAKAKADGTLSEKLSFLQQEQEKEFVNTFYVTKEDAAAVKAAGDDKTKLDGLMGKIYGKLGFHVPQDFAAGSLETTGDSSADMFVGEVNSESSKAAEAARDARLANFKAGFA